VGLWGMMNAILGCWRGTLDRDCSVDVCLERYV
jgi:hypothetical protein